MMLDNQKIEEIRRVWENRHSSNRAWYTFTSYFDQHFGEFLEAYEYVHKKAVAFNTAFPPHLTIKIPKKRETVYEH